MTISITIVKHNIVRHNSSLVIPTATSSSRIVPVVVKTILLTSSISSHGNGFSSSNSRQLRDSVDHQYPTLSICSIISAWILQSQLLLQLSHINTSYSICQRIKIMENCLTYLNQVSIHFGQEIIQDHTICRLILYSIDGHCRCIPYHIQSFDHLSISCPCHSIDSACPVTSRLHPFEYSQCFLKWIINTDELHLVSGILSNLKASQVRNQIQDFWLSH